MSEEMKINVYPLIEVVDKNSNISVVSHDSLYGRGATVNFEYKEMRLSTYQEILALLKCLENVRSRIRKT